MSASNCRQPATFGLSLVSYASVVALVWHGVLGALATWQARVGWCVDDGAVLALGDEQADWVVVELDLPVSVDA